MAVDILHHLMERTYVLAGVGERIFGFVHRTFMEYFAACYCQAEFNKRKSDFKWLTKEIFGAHWNEGEWEEVLLLLIAMLHDQGTPIREVIEHLRRKQISPVPLNLAFAARCLGEAGDVQDPVQGQLVLTELAEAIVKFVSSKRLFLEPALKAFATLAPLVTPTQQLLFAIDHLKHANDLNARIASWQMGFALRSRKERLEYALAALSDEAETVRRGAIAALEREWPGRPNIGIALAQVVRNDRQGRVRQAALAAMQRSWRSEPAILDAIASRVDEETGHRNVIRLIEYLALTWKANTKARDIVLELAGPLPKAREGFDYASVRQSAAAALAKAWPRDERVFAYLLEQARNDRQPETRAAALTALGAGWSGDAEVLRVMKERASVDSDVQTRIAGIETIAKRWRNNSDALNFLRDRFANESELKARQSVLDAIAEGWLENSEALSWIREIATSNADTESRAAALRTIATGWRDDNAIRDFVKDRVMNDSDPETRIAGLNAIEASWGADSYAVRTIQERAENDESPAIRGAALRILLSQLLAVLFRSESFEIYGWSQIDFLCDRGIHERDLPTREIVFKIFYSVLQYYRMFVINPATERKIITFLVERADNDPVQRIRLLALAAVTEAESSSAVSSALEKHIGFLREQAICNANPYDRLVAIFAIANGLRYDDHEFAFLKARAVEDAEASVRLQTMRAIVWNYGMKLKSEVRMLLDEQSHVDPDLNNRGEIHKMLQKFDLGIREYHSFVEDMEID